jgi:hypothetical protein
MEHGGMYVVTFGKTKMPALSADNLDHHHMVSQYTFLMYKSDQLLNQVHWQPLKWGGYLPTSLM